MRSFKTYIKEQEENSHIKEIKELIKSVGGGNKSAGVFESWVHIVSTIPGSRTRPTVAEVNAAAKHPEFHKEGKKWLEKIGFPGGTFSDEKVLLSIDFIGADVKEIDAISGYIEIDKTIPELISSTKSPFTPSPIHIIPSSSISCCLLEVA